MRPPYVTLASTAFSGFNDDNEEIAMRLARAALAIAIALTPCATFAQAYPGKPIRMIVPFPPGGTSDTIARTLGQKLTETWRQNVLVDNRSGVAGSIGSAATAKAPPDGYTLI